MSHRAAYYIQITKGKGSECFTASKTPVGHVMTQFRFVCNIECDNNKLCELKELEQMINKEVYEPVHGYTETTYGTHGP